MKGVTGAKGWTTETKDTDMDNGYESPSSRRWGYGRSAKTRVVRGVMGLEGRRSSQ